MRYIFTTVIFLAIFASNIGNLFCWNNKSRSARQVASNGPESIVQIVNQNAIRPYCRFLQNMTIADKPKLVEKKARQIGANYVGVIRKTLYNEYEVALYDCPAITLLSTSDAIAACDNKNSDACVELAYRETDIRESIKYLDKACALNNSYGCNVAVQAKERYKMEQVYNADVKKCDTGNGQACLSVASTLMQAGNLDGAIVMAERACVKGNKEGCMLHANYSAQKANKIRNDDAFYMGLVMQSQNRDMMLMNNAQQLYNQQMQNSYQMLNQHNPSNYNCTGYVQGGSGYFNANCIGR